MTVKDRDTEKHHTAVKPCCPGGRVCHLELKQGTAAVSQFKYLRSRKVKASGPETQDFYFVSY